MKQISIAFNDEDWCTIAEAANLKRMPIQEYIRMTLLGKKDTSIFTVEEAYRRACQMIEYGKTFSLPDLYSDEEWAQIPSTKAGAFGRQFFNYVKGRTSQVEFVGVVRRLARYRCIAAESEANYEK